MCKRRLSGGCCYCSPPLPKSWALSCWPNVGLGGTLPFIKSLDPWTWGPGMDLVALMGCDREAVLGIWKSWETKFPRIFSALWLWATQLLSLSLGITILLGTPVPDTEEDLDVLLVPVQCHGLCSWNLSMPATMGVLTEHCQGDAKWPSHRRKQYRGPQNK